MNKNKVTFITKISLILVISFFVSSVFNRELFVDNSPLMKPNLPGYFAWQINNLFSSGKNMLALLLDSSKRENLQKQKEAEKTIAAVREKLKNKPMIPLSKGVYAQTDGETTIRIIRPDEMDMIEHTFIVDGKPLKIRVPVGLPKEDVEKALNVTSKAF